MYARFFFRIGLIALGIALLMAGLFFDERDSLACQTAGDTGQYPHASRATCQAHIARHEARTDELAVWLAGRFLDHRAFGSYGFGLNREWWLGLAFGLALGAVLMAGIFMAEWATGWVRVVGMWRVDLTSGSLAQALLAPLVLFLWRYHPYTWKR